MEVVELMLKRQSFPVLSHKGSLQGEVCAVNILIEVVPGI